MAPLGRGTLTITHQGQPRRFQVNGGFLQVVSNTVRVVAEQVQGEAHGS
jgi:F0F1-type ATP synthase epsilon subunit